MLKFPDEINIIGKTLVDDNIDYKTNFETINYKRLISTFRNDIYNLIIGRKDENDYFDLQMFVEQNNCDINNNNIKKLFKTVILELNNLGWKTKLSFGNTGLFIYSTDILPSSCW